MAILDYTKHPAVLPKRCLCGNEYYLHGQLCPDCAQDVEGLRWRIISAYLLIEENLELAHQHLGEELCEALAWKLIQGQS